LASCYEATSSATNIICNGTGPSITAYGIADVVFRQSIQISGICSTGGAAVNTITYTVSQGAVTYPNDIYNNPYANYSTTCENGMYTLIITPPPDGINQVGGIAVSPAATQSQAFHLSVSINTGPTLASLTSTTFATTFYVTY
jgi:hypothetical protein